MQAASVNDIDEWDVVVKEEADQPDNNPVAAILVTAIFDNTASMTNPIKATKAVMHSLMNFLKSAIESGQSGISPESRVFVTLVAANDWTDESVDESRIKFMHPTQPVKVFVNEEECLKHCRLVPLEIDQKNIRDSFAVIANGIESMASTCTGGGDLPEEYGTAIDFVNDYVERMAATIDGHVTATTLIVTDNANHGMSRGGDDSFPQGVTEDALKQMNCYEKAFNCAYAPGGKWKPKPLYSSLAKLLKLSQVSWVLCGTSASNQGHFSTWTGLLATIFEGQSGILLSWDSDPELVKQAVVSVFCSYLAGETIPSWVDDAAHNTAAQAASQQMMSAAVQNDDSIARLSGADDNTSEVISRLAIVADLADDATRARVVEAGSDAESAAVYRTLSHVDSPVPPRVPLPTFARDAGGPPDMARTISKRAFDEYEEPSYRNLGSGDGDDEPPVYRGLGAAGVPIVADEEEEEDGEPPSISCNTRPSAARTSSIVRSMRRRR